MPLYNFPDFQSAPIKIQVLVESEEKQPVYLDCKFIHSRAQELLLSTYSLSELLMSGLLVHSHTLEPM